MKAERPADLDAQILDALFDRGPCTAAELARRLHVDSVTMSQALRSLHCQGEVVMAGLAAKQRYLWQLNDVAPASRPVPTAPTTDPDIARCCDEEHRQWMAFWRQRWQARHAHRTTPLLLNEARS